MSMKVCLSLLVVTALVFSGSAVAQSGTWYLDLQAGAQYGFAEGAHWGKDVRPLKARNFTLDEIAAPLLRWQGPRWSVSAGYSGAGLAYGYKLQVPAAATRNPYQGEQGGAALSAYAHRFPVLVSRRLARVSLYEVDTVRHLYLFSFQAEAVFGGGLQRHANQCLTCSQVEGSRGLYDTIQFRETPYYRRTWGSFLSAGVTARFYHLGRERATLRLLYTQGLQDIILVPLAYRYNGRSGFTTLHVRGSGISLTLGYPLRIYPAGRRTGSQL